MTYFAVRAAPPGPIAALVAVAAFAGFCPAMVAKALPEAWPRITPQACTGARAAVSTAALREVGADPGACDRAAWPGGPAANASVATNAPIVAASQQASPPRVPVKATNSPATVPYVRTVDTARSAARSDAWNRATASAPSP